MGHLLTTVIKVDLQKAQSLDILNDTTKEKFGIPGNAASLWNGYVGEFLKSLTSFDNSNPTTSDKKKTGIAELSPHEHKILDSITNDGGESSPIYRIVINTGLKESVVKAIIKDLLEKGLLEEKGSDFVLTEKATRLMHL